MKTTIKFILKYTLILILIAVLVFVIGFGIPSWRESVKYSDTLKIATKDVSSIGITDCSKYSMSILNMRGGEYPSVNCAWFGDSLTTDNAFLQLEKNGWNKVGAQKATWLGDSAVITSFIKTINSNQYKLSVVDYQPGSVHAQGAQEFLVTIYVLKI